MLGVMYSSRSSEGGGEDISYSADVMAQVTASDVQARANAAATASAAVEGHHVAGAQAVASSPDAPEGAMPPMLGVMYSSRSSEGGGEDISYSADVMAQVTASDVQERANVAAAAPPLAGS